MTKIALQHLLLRPEDWKGFGSVLQHFAEPFIGQTFHPDLTFGEQVLLLEFSNREEQAVLTLLHGMASQVFSEDIGMPLHDVPMLFAPLTTTNSDIVPTKREQAAKGLFYTQKLQFVRKELDGREKYSLKNPPETIFYYLERTSK